jgi:hypothetical protein
MSIEVAGLIVTTIGVIVAVFAWWFPKHSKSTSRASDLDIKPQDSPSNSGAYRNEIEVAITHMEATTFDDERAAYLVSLSKRINSIALTDLSKLVSFLVQDENRIRSVKAFSGKVYSGFSPSDYQSLMNEFTFSENKQKAAKYVHSR